MNKETIKIQGVTPLLMHNGRLADSLDPAAKTLAAAVRRAKKSKADADQLEVRRTEWYGGMYCNADSRPILPADSLEGALVEGARAHRLGKKAKGGIIVTDDALLEYPGPRTVDELCADGGFMKCAGIRVGTSRVIRTRPMFTTWSATFSVLWDPAQIPDRDTFLEIVDSAGNSGIGDWRPKYGRFTRV